MMEIIIAKMRTFLQTGKLRYGQFPYPDRLLIGSFPVGGCNIFFGRHSELLLKTFCEIAWR